MRINRGSCLQWDSRRALRIPGPAEFELPVVVSMTVFLGRTLSNLEFYCDHPNESIIAVPLKDS
jgi:hypothetical protein